MKKHLLTLVLLTVGLLPAVSAEAAEEEIALSMESTPIAGPLYRELPRPVDASLTVTVSNPPTQTKILPMKVANVTFPADMDFYPDPKKTPVCPPDKVGPNTALATGIAAVVDLCPRSVVGTGTAVVQLAQSKVPSPVNPLTDPQLVIFNAGRDQDGRPKITIYGYSSNLNTGLLMYGTLAKNGELKIDIGVMPYDSSTSEFRFDVPGQGIEVEDVESPGGTRTVKGLDPDYLRAKCSTGVWTASGEFVLGERDEATGFPKGEETFLSSNSFDLPCEGLAGKAKLKIAAVSGPGRIKAGRKGTFTVRVANPGTAGAQSLKLAAKGGGSGSVKVGRLAPGASKKVRIPVRVSKRRGKAKVKFQLTGKGLKTAKANRAVKVR